MEIESDPNGTNILKLSALFSLFVKWQLLVEQSKIKYIKLLTAYLVYT